MKPTIGEAIRLSIGKVNEDRNLYLSCDKEDDPCGCAIGTALYSLGYRLVDGVKMARKEWPWTGDKLVDCPVDDCEPDSRENVCGDVAEMVSHIHSTHDWSREEIAEWLDQIDPTIPKKEASHATSPHTAVGIAGCLVGARDTR